MYAEGTKGEPGELERSRSLLIFRATAPDERLLSYLQVHEHNEIFILLSAVSEHACPSHCTHNAESCT